MEELRAAGWKSVERYTVKNLSYSGLYELNLDQAWNKKAGKGAYRAAILQTPNGEAEVYEWLQPRDTSSSHAPKPTVAERKAADPAEAVSAGRKVYAAQRKTAAMQRTILAAGMPAALRLLVLGLLGSGEITSFRTEHKGPENRYVHPDLAVKLDVWRARLGEQRIMNHPWLEMKQGSSAWSESRDAVPLWQFLSSLPPAELEELALCLIAVRCGTYQCMQLGDTALAIEVAKDLGVDMSQAWSIDDACVATTQREQLLELGQVIGLISEDLAEWRKVKVGELRTQLVAYARANGVRHVPPEMHFASRKQTEELIRNPPAAHPAQKPARNAGNTPPKIGISAPAVPLVAPKGYELRHFLKLLDDQVEMAVSDFLALLEEHGGEVYSEWLLASGYLERTPPEDPDVDEEGVVLSAAGEAWLERRANLRVSNTLLIGPAEPARIESLDADA